MHRSIHQKTARVVLGLDRPRRSAKVQYGDKEEAELLAEYLPRAERNFSADYNGNHFQTLPPEILQTIATFTSVPPFIMPVAHKVGRHLARFRTLCRVTASAGMAAFIRLSKRPHYLEPRTLYLPTHHKLDDLSRMFKDTGLGEVIQCVDISAFALVKRPGWDYFVFQFVKDGKSKRDLGEDLVEYPFIAMEVVKSFETQLDDAKLFTKLMNSKRDF